MLLVMFNDAEHQALKIEIESLLAHQTATLISSDFDSAEALKNLRSLEINVDTVIRKFARVRSEKLNSIAVTVDVAKAREIAAALHQWSGAPQAHAYVDLTSELTLMFSKNEY